MRHLDEDERSTHMKAITTYQAEFVVSTERVPDFVDMTQRVQEVLTSSGIEHGQVTIFSPSGGCPLIVNERESGLLADIESVMDRMGGPPALGRGVIGSNSVVLPAVNGRLRLGTWQRVLLVELEKTAARPLVVQIVGQ
jgi:thiamine phosphate synthase YjbQ (UPF0047 family)